MYTSVYAMNVKVRDKRCVYDDIENCNNQLLTQQLDCHSSVLNVTSRLALRIRHLPPFEFDWSDTTPQCSRDTLTIEDFLPNEEDARIVKQCATQYIMGFLVESFTSLSDLAKFVPTPQHLHTTTKSEVVPMKMHFYDEKYKSETIKILSKRAPKYFFLVSI